MFHFLNANRKGRTTEIRLGNPSNLYSADPISMQIQFNSIGYQVHIVGVKRGRIGKQNEQVEKPSQQLSAWAHYKFTWDCASVSMLSL